MRTKTKIRAACSQAVENGYMLPHEILLKVANGEPFKQRKLLTTFTQQGYSSDQQEESSEWQEVDYYPTFSEQIDAAKAAAPYFAPRLASQSVTTNQTTAEALTEVMATLAKKLPV